MRLVRHGQPRFPARRSARFRFRAAFARSSRFVAAASCSGVKCLGLPLCAADSTAEPSRRQPSVRPRNPAAARITAGSSDAAPALDTHSSIGLPSTISPGATRLPSTIARHSRFSYPSFSFMFSISCAYSYLAASRNRDRSEFAVNQVIQVTFPFVHSPIRATDPAVRVPTLARATVPVPQQAPSRARQRRVVVPAPSPDTALASEGFSCAHHPTSCIFLAATSSLHSSIS